MATPYLTKFSGIRPVLGIKPIKPIHNAPPGKQRLRMRNNSVAKLFVRTADSIRCFVLEDRDHYWSVNPNLEQGANHRG